MPVLAEEAVEGASLIKDSQILIAIFSPGAMSEFWISNSSASGANPIGYTVSGEGVIIPTHIAFLGSDTLKLVIFIGAQSAIAYPIRRDGALI